MAKKCSVNKDLCIGCGLCTSVCPDVLVMGDDGLAEAVAEEYKERGITSDPNSLYEKGGLSNQTDKLYSDRKEMPTIGSWYKRIQRMATENTNDYKII